MVCSREIKAVKTALGSLFPRKKVYEKVTGEIGKRIFNKTPSPVIYTPQRQLSRYYARIEHATAIKHFSHLKFYNSSRSVEIEYSASDRFG